MENLVRRGENVGYHIFSFSHNVSKSLLIQGHLKSELWKEKGLNYLPDNKILSFSISRAVEADKSKYDSSGKFCFLEGTESCFSHPLFDLRRNRKVEIRHTNFRFSSENVTSKCRKVQAFDLTIVKKTFDFSTSLCLEK